MAILFNQSLPLSLGETIGSVMTSLVDAQAQSARATVDFIEEVGLERPEGGDASLRSVDFPYKKLDENGEVAEFEASVPLLSLVDLPVVSVKKAKINFAYEISETTTIEDEGSSGSERNFGFNRGGFNSRFRGVVSRKTASSRESQESANLDVEVEIEKSGLPSGLEKLLDVLELSIEDRTRG